MASLDDRQRRFCEELVTGCSGAEAARRAGYAASGARVQAQRLLSNAAIQQHVEHLRKAAQGRAGVTVDDLIEWLSELARKAEKDRDRIAAIKLLGDHLGGTWAHKPDEDSAESGGGMSIVPADTPNWRDHIPHE